MNPTENQDRTQPTPIAGQTIAPSGEVSTAPPPIASPVAVPAATNQIANGPVNQADFIALAKKKDRPKRIIKGLLVVLVTVTILGGVGGGLYMAGLLPFAKFKTVTYKNGVGDTYKMRFYVQNKSISLGSGDTASKKALVAKKGANGKLPLKIYISSAKSTLSEADYKNNKNANCAGKSPAITAYNTYSRQDIKVCDYSGSTDAANILYVATIYSKGRIQVVLIMQDIDFTKLSGGANDPAAQKAAKDILDKADLSVYNDDIKTIVGSIRPVDN